MSSFRILKISTVSGVATLSSSEKRVSAGEISGLLLSALSGAWDRHHHGYAVPAGWELC